MKRAQTYWLIFFFVLLWGIQAINLPRFLADDSYFYLVTARNLALHREQTFSGLLPTNGMHPLWLYLLSFWDWWLGHICAGCLYQLWPVLPVGLGFLALGLWASGRVAEKLEFDRLLFTGLPLGFLSAFNLLGSEAFAFYACLSILVLLALDTRMERRRWAVAIGLACAAVFLVRLDAVFFVAVFYIWFWRRCRDVRLWAIAAGTTCLPALVYLLSNRIFFGGLVPVSGWLKSTFPVPSIEGLIVNNLSTEISGYNLLFGILPLGFATLALFFFRRRLHGNDSLYIVFWGGSALHFIYTAGFTRGATESLWYYVLPVLLGTWTLALAIKVLVPSGWRDRVSAAIAGLVAILCVAYAVRTLVRTLPPTQGQVMLSYLRDQRVVDTTILVADSPGEVAFFSTNRIISLDMLTANRFFINAMLAAPNSLQFIIERAAQEGQPVEYVLLTTDTWLGWLSPGDDFTDLTYGFLVPGRTQEVARSTIFLGPPVYRRADLVVWHIRDTVLVPPPMP
jgi:hypothetical protein